MQKMKVDILRGQNQIGGSIIAISNAHTKIILDAGRELDDDGSGCLPEIKGLFDSAGYDAVFFSHYHNDHVGLARNIYLGIPLYIGEGAYQVMSAVDAYTKRDRLPVTGFLKNQKQITIRDITITPFLCDHSAYDSYMLLVEAENEKILYTGDFRSNGRKRYDYLINRLPKVDTLICEGTTLSRNKVYYDTEKEMEERATELFKNHNGPVFVMQAATNIDRIVTMYRASHHSGRIFLQDLYMACITNAIGGNIPNPNGFYDVRTFTSQSYKEGHFRRELFNCFGINKIGRTAIAKQHFTMCVRSSMLCFMKRLNQEMSFENGLLIYSMWDGYRQHEQMKHFLEECERMGLKVEALHTSGHADSEAIKEMIEHTCPRCIMPIHTENARWFEGLAKTVLLE